MKKTIQIFQPSIELDNINIRDVEFGSGEYSPDGTETKISNMVGTASPYVVINGMKFGYDNINMFIIDLEGFYPKLTIAIIDKLGLFSSTSFPKDGDVVSIFINSKTFKPIRQDYRITGTDSQPSLDNKGNINTYIITAFLNLPNLFADRFISFPNKGSFDTIKFIAKELKLGLCANEITTNDKMTRICCGIDYYDFIIDDLLPSAYKDDNSFFDCFIDQYYMMNFLQMNDLFVLDDDLYQNKINNLYNQIVLPNDNKEPDLTSIDMFLSNHVKLGKTANFIVGYTPVNNSGSISMDNGYRTFMTYYDKEKKEYVQYYTETLNSDGADDKIILKGRKDEDHRTQTRFESFGAQFNDNVHTNFYDAKLQNKLNNDEVDKLGLVCDLAGVNDAIFKGQIIPVVIVHNSNDSDMKRMAMKNNSTDKSSDDNQPILNKMWSGFYVIKNIKYIYSKNTGKIYTQIYIVKREYDSNLSVV